MPHLFGCEPTGLNLLLSGVFALQSGCHSVDEHLLPGERKSSAIIFSKGLGHGNLVFRMPDLHKSWKYMHDWLKTWQTITPIHGILVLSNLLKHFHEFLTLRLASGPKLVNMLRDIALTRRLLLTHSAETSRNCFLIATKWWKRKCLIYLIHSFQQLAMAISTIDQWVVIMISNTKTIQHH